MYINIEFIVFVEQQKLFTSASFDLLVQGFYSQANLTTIQTLQEIKDIKNYDMQFRINYL